MSQIQVFLARTVKPYLVAIKIVEPGQVVAIDTLLIEAIFSSTGDGYIDNGWYPEAGAILCLITDASYLLGCMLACDGNSPIFREKVEILFDEFDRRIPILRDQMRYDVWGKT